MPSAIDPSKPLDGGPASKADLRANLEAAKRELEHGGFFHSSLPGAVERKVADKLEDWVSIKEFGAVGNGVADDTAALQASIDAKVPTYFPTGRYKVTQPLTYVFGFAWRGESPASYSTSEPHFPRSHIFASTPFANPDEPMIHPRDVWVGVDSVVHVGPSPARNLNVVIMENLSLANAGHANAQTGYFRYLVAPSRIVGCRIGGMRRGLTITSFDAVIQSCWFSGASPFANSDWANIEEAWALAVAGEITVQGCFFHGGATGLAMHARGCNAQNLRFETCQLAILLGSRGFNDQDKNDGETITAIGTWQNSTLRNVKFEANDRDIVFLKTGDGIVVEDLVSDGTPGSPSGLSQVFAEIRNATPRSFLRNWFIGGTGWRAPLNDNKVGVISLENVTDATSVQAGQSKYVGLNGVFTNQLANPDNFYYQHLSAPNDPGWNASGVNAHPDNRTITTFANLQLRGLKGLNATKKTVQPNNFGGLEAVTEAATSHAVVFPAAPAGPSINTFTTVSDAGSTLAAGTYSYAVAGVRKNGESGVSGLGGISHKSITVASGQKVRINVFGSNNAPFVRVYRSPVGGGDGEWEGFWHVPEATIESQFEDTGQVFDGTGGPLVGDVGTHSMQEDDTDYAIVVTPSWGTTAWVTNKATTGFTINFGTAAPAGATVQWLLFRP